MPSSQPQPVKTSENTRKTGRNLTSIIGWIVGILVIGGIIWMLTQDDEVSEFEIAPIQNTIQESEELETENQLEENSTLMDILQSRDFKVHNLMGNQAVAPHAYAKVFVNKKEKLAFVDIKGLPKLPSGKNYQFWSLQMEPFNATNIGVIDENSHVEIGLSKFENFPEPQTLCITLEDEGGSETPTMSQIYVMDAIHSN